MFNTYSAQDDVTGADMAQEFLQMGHARARRYRNDKGGRTYDKDAGYTLRERVSGDPRKAKAGTIFCEYWRKVRGEPRCAVQKKIRKGRFG
jgi:hypothetical protein